MRPLATFDPLKDAARKLRHANVVAKGRARKKAGWISIRIWVPRTTADALHDRGFLREWDLENRKALGGACSEFLTANLKDDIA